MEDNGFIDAKINPFFLRRKMDVSGSPVDFTVAQGMISSIDGRVYTVWQQEHISYSIHESLACAISIHGQDNSTQFILASEELDRDDRESMLPYSFEVWHNENPNGMTRIGLVGRGVLTNNGRVIYRWLVAPYQVEFFESWESFRQLHAVHHYVQVKVIES